MKKNFYFYTNLFAWSLVFLLIGNYVFGWTTPTGNPPSSNLSAPINVSAINQSKEGYLAIATSTAPTIPLNVVGTANMTTLSIGGTSITATPAELNFVDGVTSAIQTQLGTKAPLASPAFTGSVTMPGTGIWNSSGSVGIGTTSPTSKLHVLGSKVALSETVLTLNSQPNGVGEYIELLFDSTYPSRGETAIRSVVGAITTDTDLAFLVDTGSGRYEAMRIKGDGGNVGIGTTAPKNKLDVEGGGVIGAT